MTEISLSEAKGQLFQLLDRVQAGERFLITVCDRPVAELIPYRPVESDNVRWAIEGLKLFQQTHQLKGLSVHQMIDEGRKH